MENGKESEIVKEVKEFEREIVKAENKFANNLKKNPWITSAFVFVVISLILLFVAFNGRGVSGVSSETIGINAVTFINTQVLQGNGAVALNSVAEKGGLYEVIVSYNGQMIPTYFTNDGKYYLGNQILSTASAGNPASNNAASSSSKDVQKSDKPVVEAFIFSYCPYGLQFEKALFPAYDLLKDKADFRIVAIGAMHGEFEHVESLRQISIEQLYGNDKLFSYLKEFDVNSNLGACKGEETCSGKYLPVIYNKLGIDKTKVDAYMKNNAEKVYKEQNARSSSVGVSGSPTFVINGAEVQVNRDADSIKEAVCNSFSAKPSECSQSLSSQPASPGFG